MAICISSRDSQEYLFHFLARFSEEDDNQVDELFFACQIELERLSKTALVIVSATPRPPLERLGFVLQRITQAWDPLGKT